MDKKKFLLVSPMLDSGSFLPINISIITAILKKAGYEVKLFETTFYRISLKESFRKSATEEGMFKPVNWDDYRMENLKDDYLSDFKNIIRSFKPDFIGVSIFTTYNEKLAISLIDAIDDDYKGKVIVGGIHAFVNAERLKKNKRISAIITGECEDMLIDALDYLYYNKTDDTCDIPNFSWRNNNNQWIDSGVRKIPGIENIPFLNWDYFDNRNFYRPFDGKILRMGHVEMARGCPYRCTYCINEHFHKQFRRYWRIKSTDRILEEVSFLKNEYKLDAIKIWDDDFLAMGIGKIASVTYGLKKMNLKFLSHSRPEHINEEKIRLLAENGCVQIGIGVESGSAEYRKKMLNRRMSNESIIRAFEICRNYNIITTAYCMIGMPDETREDIISTAKLLRKANPHVIVHAIFIPYEGNTLYQYAKDKGYIDKNIDYENMMKCYLNMPSIAKEEVESLNRTFIFYCRFEDSIYPLIKKAEKNEDEFMKMKAMLSSFQM